MLETVSSAQSSFEQKIKSDFFVTAILLPIQISNDVRKLEKTYREMWMHIAFIKTPTIIDLLDLFIKGNDWPKKQIDSIINCIN